MSLFLFAEFHTSQLIATQQIHASTERRNRQELLVDDQSRCQAGQIRPSQVSLNCRRFASIFPYLLTANCQGVHLCRACCIEPLLWRVPGVSRSDAVVRRRLPRPWGTADCWPNPHLVPAAASERVWICFRTARCPPADFNFPPTSGTSLTGLEYFHFNRK